LASSRARKAATAVSGTVASCSTPETQQLADAINVAQRYPLVRWAGKDVPWKQQRDALVAGFVLWQVESKAIAGQHTLTAGDCCAAGALLLQFHEGISSSVLILQS
jgi:hypothetical protein